MTARIEEDLKLTGNLTVEGTTSFSGATSGVGRTELDEDSNRAHHVPFVTLAVHDSMAKLPTAGANDDLGHYAGTYGTNTDYIGTGDLKAAGATTRYARFSFQLPPEYVSAGTITIRARCGMLTTIADNTCTIDFEAYLSDDETLVSGADLVSTAATDMNSTTFADKDFTVTATGRSAGEVLDIRMAIACNDAATGTAVDPCVGRLEILCDCKG